MSARAAERQACWSAARSSSALVLVGAYLAAGGSSYTPEKIQDPCEPAALAQPRRACSEIAEQFSLSALDGAACQLGVTPRGAGPGAGDRRRRASASRERYGIDDEKLAKAIRAGLLRAVDDAEEAGALSRCSPARCAAVESIPLDQAIELINDAERSSATSSPSSARPKPPRRTPALGRNVSSGRLAS